MKGDQKMSSRINVSKKAISFIVMLVLILASLSTPALASNQSKTVTREATYTFFADYEEVKEYCGSPRNYVPSTQSYDDGIYKGTLSIASITGYPTYIAENVLEVKIYVTYSGTVYAYVTTKNVYCETTYTFYVHSSQLSFYTYYPSSHISPTYIYNDGIYEGILNLSYCTCSSPIYAIGGYYWVTINAGYFGAVQIY